KADRNYEKIPPRPSEPIQAPMQYDFKSFAFRTRQVNPVLRPLRVKSEEVSRVYGGYLSAGYGNYASPYVEGFINSRRDKNKLIGAHGLFSGSDKGPVDEQNSGSGLSKVSIYGKTFNEYVSLSGDVGFENRTTHFYGYPDGTSVEAKDIKQAYNQFKMKGEIANAKASSFGYNLAAGFSYLADKFDATESEIDLDFASRYHISDDSGLGLSAGYYLINRKDALFEAAPRSLFFVNPRYEFYPMADLKVSAGMIAAIENDTIDNKNVHAYPDLKVSYPVSPSVELVGAFTGGIEKVSLQTLSNENIWIGANIPIFHTNKAYDLQAALHTRIGNRVSLNGGFSIAGLKNWYFFVNSTADQSRFAPVYETGETVRSNFFASIGFAHEEYVNILVRGDLFSYNTDKIEQAWHRPTYKVMADASFNIARKVLLDLSIISQGGVKAWDPALAQTVELAPAFDLNIRTEYMISKSFSVFAQLNNITSNNYPLYLHYPVRGFQAIGGLTWSF
ncbi:MAG TPA: hypothetical protein VEB86_16960, partial [Chryseosolibacter sp.]|nr:hypothetical protein [Chryseosolibacter sp.]